MPENQSETVFSPYSLEKVGEVAVTDVAGTDQACQRAAAAFCEWRLRSPFERATFLQDFACRLRGAAPDLAHWLSLEAGKPIAEAYAEIGFAADAFDFYAGLARSRGGRVAPPLAPTSTSLVIKEPVGVVAAILPWNYPILLWAWKAAPALAAGCTVVAKPSPITPLSLPAVAALLELPDGVHQIVQGGEGTALALIDHPLVAKIAFTGSSRVGTSILARAAGGAKRVSVEMSGHDAFIVGADADPQVAAEAAAFATFINAGQVCTSAERILVARPLFDTFVSNLASCAQALRLGDPTDFATEFGPVASPAQFRRVESYVANAKARGATVVTGGRRAEGHTGLFFEPTVLTGLAHSDLLELGEVFGPIAPVVPFDTMEEAIALSNASPHGLSANVLTADLGDAMLAARDLRVGTVWINGPLMDNPAAPFGGFGMAGIGRELGEEGLEAYLESKHVAIEHRLERKPWWFEGRREAGADA
jgi:acyl-CoA reductase-like NAD-dependent aldehyde dehydrogenase